MLNPVIHRKLLKAGYLKEGPYQLQDINPVIRRKLEKAGYLPKEYSLTEAHMPRMPSGEIAFPEPGVREAATQEMLGLGQLVAFPRETAERAKEGILAAKRGVSELSKRLMTPLVPGGAALRGKTGLEAAAEQVEAVKVIGEAAKQPLIKYRHPVREFKARPITTSLEFAWDLSVVVALVGLGLKAGGGALRIGRTAPIITEAGEVAVATTRAARAGTTAIRVGERMVELSNLIDPSFPLIRGFERATQRGSVIIGTLLERKALKGAAKAASKAGLKKAAMFDDAVAGLAKIAEAEKPGWGTIIMDDLVDMIETGGRGKTITHADIIDNAITSKDPLTMTYLTKGKDPKVRTITEMRWAKGKGKNAVSAMDSISGERRTFSIRNIQDFEGIQSAPTDIVHDIYGNWSAMPEDEQRLWYAINSTAKRSIEEGNPRAAATLWDEIGKKTNMSREEAMNYFLGVKEEAGEASANRLRELFDLKGKAPEEAAETVAEALKDAGVADEVAEAIGDDVATAAVQATAKGVTPEQQAVMRTLGYTEVQIGNITSKGAQRVIDDNISAERAIVTKTGVLRVKKAVAPVEPELPARTIEPEAPVEVKPPELLLELTKDVPEGVSIQEKEVVEEVAPAVAEAPAVEPTAPALEAEVAPEVTPEVTPAPVTEEVAPVAVEEAPPPEVVEEVAPVAAETWQMTEKEWMNSNAREQGFTKANPDETVGEFHARQQYGPEDYPRINQMHVALVRRALQEGKPVPPEVLAEYPDLVQETPGQEGIPPELLLELTKDVPEGVSIQEKEVAEEVAPEVAEVAEIPVVDDTFMFANKQFTTQDASDEILGAAVESIDRQVPSMIAENDSTAQVRILAEAKTRGIKVIPINYGDKYNPETMRIEGRVQGIGPRDRVVDVKGIGTTLPNGRVRTKAQVIIGAGDRGGGDGRILKESEQGVWAKSIDDIKPAQPTPAEITPEVKPEPSPKITERVVVEVPETVTQRLAELKEKYATEEISPEWVKGEAEAVIKKHIPKATDAQVKAATDNYMDNLTVQSADPVTAQAEKEETVGVVSSFLKSEDGFARRPTKQDMKRAFDTLKAINRSERVGDFKETTKYLLGHHAVTPEMILNSQGPAGRVFTRELRMVDSRYKAEAGRIAYDVILPIRKDLTDLEWENMVDVLEAKANPFNDKVETAAEKLRTEYDKVADEWTRLKGTIRIYDEYGKPHDIPFKKRENYFQHSYPAEMFKDKEFMDEIVEQLAEEMDVSEVEARKIIEQARMDKTGMRMGNLEMARQTDMPGYRRDAGSVIKYFTNAWKRVELSRSFGPKYEKFDDMIDTIKEDGGDPILMREVFGIYTGNIPMAEGLRKHVVPVTRQLKRFQILTKMGRASIANFFEGQNIPMALSWKTNIQGIFDWRTKEGKRQLDITGAVIHDAIRHIGSGAEKDWIFQIGAPGFTVIERNLRRVAAASGGRWFKDNEVKLRRAINKGNKRREATARRELKRWGFDPDDVLENPLGTPETDKRMREGMNRAADFTQKAYGALDIPPGYMGPYGSAIAQFKSWSLMQAKFMADTGFHGVAEAFGHGNMMPLMRWLLAMGVFVGTGEIVSELRSWLYRRDRTGLYGGIMHGELTKKEIANLIMQDFLAVTSLGQMSIILEALEYHDPFGAVLGPLASDISAVERMVRKPSTVTKELLKRVPVVGAPAASWIFPYQKKKKKGGLRPIGKRPPAVKPL